MVEKQDNCFTVFLEKDIKEQARIHKIYPTSFLFTITDRA